MIDSVFFQNVLYIDCNVRYTREKSAWDEYNLWALLFISFYLKLLLISRQWFLWGYSAQLVDGNVEVVSSYLSISTCYQLIQSIMDEHVLWL